MHLAWLQPGIIASHVDSQSPQCTGNLQVLSNRRPFFLLENKHESLSTAMSHLLSQTGRNIQVVIALIAHDLKTME